MDCHKYAEPNNGVRDFFGSHSSQVSFLVASPWELGTAATKRHLQRTLAVDEDVAAKWKRAFDRNEVACEQLGSIHFLSHGIFAFKVDALGARTDLVFNEPPDDLLLMRGIDGLVLTEWKVAHDAKSAAKGFREARTQADLYKQGALAGIELTQQLVAIERQRSLLNLTPRERVPLDWLSAMRCAITFKNCALEGKGASPIVGARSCSAHPFRNSTRSPSAFEMCHPAASQEM